MSWQRTKVLVTGADGFIGSHLTEALARAGASIRALCLYNSHGSSGWLDEIEPHARASLEIRLGDVRDAGFIARCCEDVDVVFHLAALIAIPYSYQAPESYVDTNVHGTLNVLEGARRARCRRVVHVSTSEVYGTPDTLPITEDHPLRGQSPYSATKIAAEKLAEAYWCSFGVPAVTIRPFNTYGPRQSARAIVPAMLSQLLAGQSVVRLGSLSPSRDLTYVSDTVDGLLAAGLTAGLEGQVVQLGTGQTWSVGDLFRIASTVCGVTATVALDPARVRPEKSEVLVLQSDPSRAARLLGWSPRVPLETGLRCTAEWMRAHACRFHPEMYAV